MGEFGDLRFPYPLDRHAPRLQPDAAFQRLAELVKRRFGLAGGTLQQPRVVIARRQRTRILANADALQARLLAAGIETSVVDFGAMSFEAQVSSLSSCSCSFPAALWIPMLLLHTLHRNRHKHLALCQRVQVRIVHSAAVLVSVHGADCMNLMFLPRAGCLVEVLPMHYGYGRRDVMRKGDYFNLARLLGKQYVEVVSTAASSIIRDASGQLADWNHVNFVGNVTVDLDATMAAVRSAVVMACDGQCAALRSTQI